MQIGRHLSIKPSFTSTPLVAHSLGCNIFQIFLANPRVFTPQIHTSTELGQFTESMHELNLQVVIHGSYACNFCHPIHTQKFTKSQASLQADLRACEAIGIRCLGVILHMGKNIPTNNIDDGQARANYITGLQQALDATKCAHIILETGAHQGHEIASCIPDLAVIWHALEPHHQARVAFCVDTCHIWASGYDISCGKGVTQFFDLFDREIGIDKIACIHLNDSRNGLGSHVDRHADLTHGMIGADGLAEICRRADRHKIPIIMETPLRFVDLRNNQRVTHANQATMIRKWIRQR